MCFFFKPQISYLLCFIKYQKYFVELQLCWKSAVKYKLFIDQRACLILTPHWWRLRCRHRGRSGWAPAGRRWGTEEAGMGWRHKWKTTGTAGPSGREKAPSPAGPPPARSPLQTQWLKTEVCMSLFMNLQPAWGSLFRWDWRLKWTNLYILYASFLSSPLSLVWNKVKLKQNFKQGIKRLV